MLLGKMFNLVSVEIFLGNPKETIQFDLFQKL